MSMLAIMFTHLYYFRAENTSAKRRKGYSLFSAAFALPVFVKNAVAFLKLFWFTNAAISIAALVNQST